MTWTPQSAAQADMGQQAWQSDVVPLSGALRTWEHNIAMAEGSGHAWAIRQSGARHLQE